MPKRVCYIHIGPHKTGTSSIQWFLKENRAELLKYGYFVPESGTLHGAHHTLGRKLCGQPLPDQQDLAAITFARDLEETPSEAVIISSETLDGLLRNAEYAKNFFRRIEELNLIPKLVLFPRNQPETINSSYAEAVKSFCVSQPFESLAQGLAQRPALRYSPLLQLTDAYHAELIVRPFTGKTIAHGAIPEFLEAIGVDASQFPDTNVRRNQSVGPFTVGVARGVSDSIGRTGQQFKWRQAMRCKTELATYLEQRALADTAYCGLTTALARHIEATCRPDNDAFAERVWNISWDEMFADDLGRKFVPNDFAVCEPDEPTKRLLARAIDEMTVIVQEIMLDPVLAVEAPWNDLQQRAGWPSPAQTKQSAATAVRLR
jgi:hypothetical protein